MAKRTWLITGVAGFVGNNMALHYLQQGDTVVGLDNFYSGSKENLPANTNFHFYELDICSDMLEGIFQDHSITHILHLAAVVSVPICEERPEFARKTNIEGLENIFSVISKKAIKQFIYASSSAVYGAAKQLPISEDVELKPISVYGQTKVENEKSAEAFCNEASIPCIGLRFFNLFGGNPAIKNDYAAVMPIWVNAIKNDQAAVIYGKGDATRDFCYIDNVANAMDCIVSHDLTGNHVFNIGTQQETTLKNLFEMLCDVCEKHPEPEYKPWRDTDILHSCADISKAKNLLGYQPKINVEQGIKKWLI